MSKTKRTQPCFSIAPGKICVCGSKNWEKTLFGSQDLKRILGAILQYNEQSAFKSKLIKCQERQQLEVTFSLGFRGQVDFLKAEKV